METKQIDQFELKVDVDAAGTFTALVSTFDKLDKRGDIVRRGAFADSIAAWRAKGAKVPVVFSHNDDDIMQHVGEVDPAQLVETSVGLQAEGTFYLDEPIAKKVFAQLRRKALSDWSFGYVVQRATPRPSGGRELLALDLVELGPCLRGMGDTTTIGVKGTTTPAAAGPLAAYRWQLDRALRRNAIAFARTRSR